MACTIDLSNVLNNTTPSGGEWSVTDGPSNNGSFRCPTAPGCAGDADGETNPQALSADSSNGYRNNIIHLENAIPGCYRFSYYTMQTSPAYNAVCDCGGCVNYELLVYPGPIMPPNASATVCPGDCGPGYPDVINVLGYFDCGALAPTYDCATAGCDSGLRFGVENGLRADVCRVIFDNFNPGTFIGTTHYITEHTINFGHTNVEYSGGTPDLNLRQFADCNGNYLSVGYNLSIIFLANSVEFNVTNYYTSSGANRGRLEICRLMEENPGVNTFTIQFVAATVRSQNFPLPDLCPECTKSCTVTYTRGNAPDPGTFSGKDIYCKS